MLCYSNDELCYFFALYLLQVLFFQTKNRGNEYQNILSRKGVDAWTKTIHCPLQFIIFNESDKEIHVDNLHNDSKFSDSVGITS